MINFFMDNMYLDYALRILAATVCGFILGLERKQRQEIIGMRTLILISLASCLLAIVSQRIAARPDGYGDQGRVAAQVVSGIGFIGGGVILKQGFNVKGITTAAIIFIASALGLSCGIRLYYPTILVLIICIFMLKFFQKIEHRFFPSLKIKQLTLVFSTNNVNEKQIKEIILNNGVIIRDLNIATSVSKEKTTLSYSIKCPNSLDSISLINSLSALSKLEKITFTE